MSNGVSEAFYECVTLIGKVTGQKPLPNGLSTAKAGDWILTVNASSEPLSYEGREVEPFTVFVENTTYFVFGIIAPNGGMIGGMSEDEFIAQIRALNAEQVPA